MKALRVPLILVLGLVAPTTFAQTPAATPAPPVFGASVESVYVDVLASRDGQPLTGLTAADFEVRDNGVVQAAELASAPDGSGGGRVPNHAILVLDGSASVGPKLPALKQAARAFLGGLRADDRASLITFNQRISLRQAAGAPQTLLAALDATRAEGGTALHDAVYSALELADPRQGRPVVVVFSDGDDRLSWLSADKVVRIARESDAAVYAVDTQEVAAFHDAPRRREGNNQVNEDRSGFLASGGRAPDLGGAPAPTEERPATFLELVADETGGQVFRAGSSDIAGGFQRVLSDLKSRYVLRYAPAGGAKPGWHELKVRLKTGKGDLRVRHGYMMAGGPS
jgi:VWFA-related protein